MDNNKSNQDVSTKMDLNSQNKYDEKYYYRTFYIEKYHAKALAYEKAKTGKYLSEIVREALDQYFGAELEIDV